MAKAPRALEHYRAKRDFERTREPSGDQRSAIAPSEHLRFVIQKHDATRLHYDLRLETGDGVFWSWAVTKGPSLDPGQKRLAVEVEAHPLEYGDFEGTIPEGEYGGGTVMIWDRGFWASEDGQPFRKALDRGEIKFVLAGQKLQGSWVIVRMKRRAGERKDNWLLIKHRDQWAREGDDDGVLAEDKSVASGRTMQQIARGAGKPAKPFMTGNSTAPDAVWSSAEKPAAALAARATSASARTSAMTTARPKADKMSPPTPPKLTHPDRELWPAHEGQGPYTKRDLADYLVAVAPWMIRHIADIPCSFLRAPDGIGAEMFFQRHPMRGQSPLIETVRVDREHEPYLLIPNVDALVALAQISVVELHPWNTAPGRPLVPGRLVLDLDPAEDVPFDAVVETAIEMRERLERVGLAAFCKTTGGKGLHVVTPLMPDESIGWPQAKLFAQTLCAQMAGDSPSRYVTTMAKKARGGKIFLDYLRNDFTATAVAPLSPRGRPGAPVSMPLTWSQVRRGLDPKRYTIATVPSLLAKSRAWADYDRAASPLKGAIEKLLNSGGP